MKVKVSDYIAAFLARHGIGTVFSVVGGGSMHLNDSLGHHPKLHVIYNHHEQASAMAAEGYFRVKNEISAVCVTSGPGAINALNGVVGAYQDSIPMLVFSGQTKTGLTVFNSSLPLRTLGNQEFDIVGSLNHMAKYAEMIMDPRKIRYCLEKAYHLAMSDRPGPCWLDIPLDIQGCYVETEELHGLAEGEQGYRQGEIMEERVSRPVGETDPDRAASAVMEKLAEARRPVLYAGNGVRIAGAVERLRILAHEMTVPVVTCWDSIDVMETDDSCYAGRGGTMGDRAGNFAVQNSDLLICIGTRLNIYQVGYSLDSWARAAYVVVNDIDPDELRKPTIRVDMGVCCDAGAFIKALEDANQQLADNKGLTALREKWLDQCQTWKKKYPVIQPKCYAQEGAVNVYAFVDSLSHMLPPGSLTVVANGSASVVGSQTFYIGRDCRFMMNCGMSSMGYGLPAAIGVSEASGKGTVICIEGDGSIMMNLQELQTIATNRLPIKLFIINNNGYHQIRQTQNNIFHNGLVGVGPESGDLGFPAFDKLADAFGLPYMAIRTQKHLAEGLRGALAHPGPLVCEVVCDTKQIFEPKSATKKLPDGTLVSPPLEDMAPFLPRKELAENMYIELV